MAKKGTATARIGLDYSAFAAGSKAVQSIATNMNRIVVGAIAFGAVKLGLDSLSGIKNAIMDVINLGEETANAGHIAGMAAGNFMIFSAAMEKGITRNTAASLIGDNAAILDRSAGTFRDVAIKLWAVGEKVKGFWLGVLDQVAPVLSKMLDSGLGVNLVAAGERFGKVMRDAFGVIYQLAADGNLWSGLGDMAAAAFRYATDIGSGLIEILFTKAFWSSINSFLTGMGSVIEQLASNLFTALSNAFNDLQRMWARIFPDLINADLIPANRTSNPLTNPNDKDPLTALKDLFANTKLEIPPSIIQALDKFNAGAGKDSGQQFENTKVAKNFAVSSLAAIGGGGGVGPGTQLLTVAQQHAKTAEQSDKKLSEIRDANRLVAAQLKEMSGKMDNGGTITVTNR